MATMLERAWPERADVSFSSCKFRTASSFLLCEASSPSNRPCWRISPNAHAASTSRTELETMVTDNTLFSAAVLSLSSLAKLLLSADG